MPKKFAALLPIRGGSKSIPNKNIKLINGKPLFYWSLKAAFDSKIFDEIFVSSDRDEFLDLVSQHFPIGVNVIKRSLDLAQDRTSTEEVLLDFANNYEFDVLCTIQVTSPLTKAIDFTIAKKKFLENDFDSLVTCVRKHIFTWSDDGNPINYNPQKRPRRQDFNGLLCENGAFYFTKKNTLLEKKCRLGDQIAVYEMAENSFVEIDEPSDWEVVENLLKKQNTSKPQNKIKGFVLDIDGTLTDGGMYYSESGEYMKKFNTKDAQGLALLKEKGIRIAVITGEDSPSVTSRISKLNISDYYKGIKDKVPTLQKIADDWGIKTNEIAYIGDDIGDIDCIIESGYSFCPNDSVSSIKKLVDKICTSPGGHGAVREACDFLLLNME